MIDPADAFGLHAFLALARPLFAPHVNAVLARALTQLVGGHAPSCQGSAREGCGDWTDHCDIFEGLPIENVAELTTALGPFAEQEGRLGAEARVVLVLCARHLAHEINECALERDSAGGAA